METTFSETPANNSNVISFLSKEKIGKGLRCFAILTIISFAIVFYATSTEETIAALSHLNIGFLVLAAFLQLADIALGALRNHILVRKLKPGISPWVCFKAQLANEFAAAVTPGQSGGGPAWVYILYRNGIPIASAAAVSVIVFISTLFFFLSTTTTSVFYLEQHFSIQTILQLLQYGFLTCTVLFLLILFSLWLPDKMGRIIHNITRLFSRFGKRWGECSVRCGERIIDAMTHYQINCVDILKKDPITVLKTFLITGLYYFVKLNMAYVILLGLGIQIDYLTAIAVLALLRFILYFTPTPGGSGVAEISIAVLVSLIMPTYLLLLFTILYRSYHLFLPAGFGAWVIISELKKAA
jgi:uncharacterized protein (TIRG00374 family)